MRLFIALDIDDNIRERIVRFLDGVRGFAPDARWVKPESLHITLKFIGEKSEEETEIIKRALETITAKMFEINIRGYGFFPTSRMPRVFWIGIDPGKEVTALAAAVDEKLSALGIRKEEHAFSPHLSLGVGRSPVRPANKGTTERTATSSACRKNLQPCLLQSLVR